MPGSPCMYIFSGERRLFSTPSCPPFPRRFSPSFFSIFSLSRIHPRSIVCILDTHTLYPRRMQTYNMSTNKNLRKCFIYSRANILVAHFSRRVASIMVFINRYRTRLRYNDNDHSPPSAPALARASLFFPLVKKFLRRSFRALGCC